MAGALGRRIPRRQREVVAGLLRELRQERGLRQEDLADRLGVPRNVVSNLELGERRLDVLELRLVCAALEIAPATFLDRLDAALRTGA